MNRSETMEICESMKPGEPSAAQPLQAEPDILFCDAHLIVAIKPAGLLSVPGRGADKQDCLSARLQSRYPDALVVHRLDMATSGLFLAARGALSQRLLGHAFAQGDIGKRYIAIVAGQLDAQSGLIDLPIAADWPRRPLRMIDARQGKPSRTRWRVLERLPDGNTRIELEPQTGRTHQLRVHLKAIGHPILGDMLYASEPVRALAPRLLLHACHLSLTHPATGESMLFNNEPPF